MASVIQALHEIPSVPGITVAVVPGFGKRTPATSDDAPQFGETEMAKLETVVPEELLERVVDTIQEVASTGRPGDGRLSSSASKRP